MRLKIKGLIAAIVVTCTVATIVYATPTVGQLFTVLSSGTINEEIVSHVRVPLPNGNGDNDRDDEWTAKLFTSGPANFQVVDVTLLPGGYTGWHSHPGILLTSVISGSIEWYDDRCEKHVYNAGDSLTETTRIHDVRNVGTTNAHFMVTYVIAKGQPRRIDQPAPACAAGLGLE